MKNPSSLALVTQIYDEETVTRIYDEATVTRRHAEWRPSPSHTLRILVLLILNEDKVSFPGDEPLVVKFGSLAGRLDTQIFYFNMPLNLANCHHILIKVNQRLFLLAVLSSFFPSLPPLVSDNQTEHQSF